MLTQLITGPTTEPVTLAEAAEHLRLEEATDHPYVNRLLVAARQWVEEYCWRGVVTQTWELVLEEFPTEDEIELPKGHLASITSAKYIDGAGVEQTWSSLDYVADSASVPGKLRLGYGKSWPSARSQWDAVKVRYVVGWTVQNVPQPIKQAVLLLVSQMFEQRTPEVVGTIISQVRFAVEALLAPYRLSRF